MPEELDTPLEPLTLNPAGPSNILLDEYMDASLEEQFESIFDGEGAVLLGDLDSACVVGIGRIEGFPVVFALTGGESRSALTTADVKRIAKAASWSADFQIPFISTQDTLGYDPANAATAEFMHAAARAVESLRGSHAAKITIVTGWGYLLGDFVLGGLGTGFDMLWCWPSGRIGVTESPGYLARDPESPPADDPWAAADLGIVSEMITPADTREWLATGAASNRAGSGAAGGALRPRTANPRHDLNRWRDSCACFRGNLVESCTGSGAECSEIPAAERGYDDLLLVWV